jgi:olfactory receptor
MEQNSGTDVSKFILLELAGQHKFWHIFVALLLICVTTLVGNIGMILLIKVEFSFNTPMHFFLQNLAFVDLCYTSAITPKMLQNIVRSKASIPS